MIAELRALADHLQKVERQNSKYSNPNAMNEPLILSINRMGSGYIMFDNKIKFSFDSAYQLREFLNSDNQRINLSVDFNIAEPIAKLNQILNQFKQIQIIRKLKEMNLKVETKDLILKVDDDGNEFYYLGEEFIISFEAVTNKDFESMFF